MTDAEDEAVSELLDMATAEIVRLKQIAGVNNTLARMNGDRAATAERKLTAARELINVLLENEPDDLISDAGHTVLDAWRADARRLLSAQPKQDEPRI